MTRKTKGLSFIIMLSVIFCFISCRDDLKVTILEPLSTDVIQKYAEKDSLFLNTYNNLRRLVDSVYKINDINLEYAHLTYSSFYDLAKKLKYKKEELSSDSSFIQDWNNKHKNDLMKFEQDSIRYEKYIEKNHYSNFLDFELLQIFEQETWLLNENYAEILIKPKNGHGVRRVAGSVKIVPKDMEGEVGRYNYEYADANFSYRGFTKKNVKVTGVDGRFKESLSSFLNIPINIIKQKYNIAFYVDELVIDDQYVDVKLDSVPYLMRYFIKDGDEYGRKELYIQDHINKDFISLKSFIIDQAVAKLAKEYKSELDFYTKGLEIQLLNLD